MLFKSIFYSGLYFFVLLLLRENRLIFIIYCLRGYGDPNERDKQKVETDVIEGYISKKHAWEEYKYE